MTSDHQYDKRVKSYKVAQVLKELITLPYDGDRKMGKRCHFKEVAEERFEKDWNIHSIVF